MKETFLWTNAKQTAQEKSTFVESIQDKAGTNGNQLQDLV
jgi:hypothetical protein